MKTICKDLAAEYDDLDALVAGLDETDWAMATPFDGWRIRDQITHLAYFDRAACLSATDEEAFAKDFSKMLEDFTTYEALYAKINSSSENMTSSELLNWWRRERQALLEGIVGLDPKTRVPWYGPSMSVRSSATARLMETWAHGQDIFDALHQHRAPTPRLKHVAHLGVATFEWSFVNRKMTVPPDEVRVELTNPENELWTWGPEDATNRVGGHAQDFCLVVSQRRHYSDTGLTVTGESARKWMENAQVFAGPPEAVPRPGER